VINLLSSSQWRNSYPEKWDSFDCTSIRIGDYKYNTSSPNTFRVVVFSDIGIHFQTSHFTLKGKDKLISDFNANPLIILTSLNSSMSIIQNKNTRTLEFLLETSPRSKLSWPFSHLPYFSRLQKVLHPGFEISWE